MIVYMCVFIFIFAIKLFAFLEVNYCILFACLLSFSLY